MLAIVGSAPLASHCYLIVDDVGTALVQFCAGNKAVAFILPRVVDGYAQQLVAVEGLDMQDMLLVKARCCHIRRRHIGRGVGFPLVENNLAVGGIPMDILVVGIVIALVERYEDRYTLGQYAGLFEALDNGIKHVEFVVDGVEVLGEVCANARIDNDIATISLLYEVTEVTIDLEKQCSEEVGDGLRVDRVGFGNLTELCEFFLGCPEVGEV